PGTTSHATPGEPGMGGGALPTHELTAWSHATLTQAKSDASRLGRQMEELYRDVQSYVHRQDHTPSAWPVSGRITSGFGERVHPITQSRSLHEGIDIA